MPYTLSSSSRGERLYFGLVIAIGTTIAAVSAFELWRTHAHFEWLALAALTLLTGSFTVRIPRLSIRISVSDAFVFASVFIYGPEVATVIVAIDSLVATLWMRRENRSVFRSAFNLSVASASIWIAATAFDWLAPPPFSALSDNNLIVGLGPYFVLAALYFLFNSFMIAAALAFEHKEPVVKFWWKHFPWFSLNYFGGVSAAALLVSYTQTFDIKAVGIILPLLVISYLTYRTSLGRVQDAELHLEQMNALYMSTIEALAMAVDAKDQITHGHIRRVQVYAVELARRLGVIDTHQLAAIETAALLHDMGKLAIPEHILNKPGKLSVPELTKMKRHADIGADLLSSIKFPYPVVPIVRYHHEHWNGAGYPTGISRTDIPLGARILSVVDCFDALTSDRPYRPRLSTEQAFSILRERRGTMYDPLVVDTFIDVHSDIAPKAVKAGQEARSMLASANLQDPDRVDDIAPLRHIRSNAFETSVLAELRERLAPCKTLEEAIDEVASHVRQLTAATVVALYRYDLDSDSLVCDATAGDSQGLIRGIAIRPGERVSGWCAANRRTSVNSHAHLDLGALSDLFSPPLQSTISAPLVRDQSLVGVLTAYSPKPEAFVESQRYLFEHVAELVAQHLSAIQHQTARGTVIAFRSTQS